jgi:hypothetical protein
MEFHFNKESSTGSEIPISDLMDIRLNSEQSSNVSLQLGMQNIIFSLP